MSRILDREGSFKALPMMWGLQSSENSQSVALVVTFRVVAQFADGEWHDWSEYEDHEITGYFYIVKRDGAVNTQTVENLVKSLGWDGNLDLSAGPPETTCQITVASEEYNGKERLKVQWLNPGDYVPGPKTADPETVRNISAKYGSQLRAAAAAAKPKTTAKAKAAPPPARTATKPAATAPAPETGSIEDDDLPFEDRPAAHAGDTAAGQDAGGADRRPPVGNAVAREDGTPASAFIEGLKGLDFEDYDLDTMTLDELRAYANAMASDMELGERRMLKASLAASDRPKVVRALRAIMDRRAVSA